MTSLRGFLRLSCMAALATAVLLPPTTSAQETSAPSASKSEQWIHVRVESKEDPGETVRVNVPVEMAAKVLPAIHDKNLHDGKVRLDCEQMKDVDLRAILDAVRTARDGEYVTVQSRDSNVRVAKSGGYLLIHVIDMSEGKNTTTKDSKAGPKAGTTHQAKVQVKVPMKVVDALLSAGKDELDIVAALRALSAHGDTELVTVKDDENTVRVWVDSKNVAD